MIDREADFGTPAVTAGPLVALTIDGRPASVPAGTSVLRAAAEIGIAIPRLCATDLVSAYGSCRLCIVEIAGRRGTPASCTTPVEAGMVVSTNTPRLTALRRGIIELYLSDHPTDCLTCAANGACELQTVAGQVGLRTVRRLPDSPSHCEETPQAATPYFSYDPARCIVCARCVRACAEVQGSFALTVAGRGFASRIRPGEAPDFLGSDCVACGACVQVCPTAALIETSVSRQGQPTRVVETTCAYCGVGCSLRAEAQGETMVRMVPSRQGGANQGHACIKGRFAWGWATHKDRITTPMIRERRTDPWRVVGWDEAIAFAASRFRAIQARYGHRAIGGITSSRCTNEEVFAVQKMIRAAFGNNNVDTCARVCHSPTGYGLKQTFGTSAGTQDFKSVDQADVILVIGANPTDGHPVFAARLSRRVRQGAKLVVIDPRRTDLVDRPHARATLHLPLLPGSNVAMVNALAHVIVTEGWGDEAFVAARCDMDSFRAWAAFIADPANAPETVESITGVAAGLVREAARLYATAGNGAIYYGLGVTEHSQGSTTVMAIANLAMATGNIGREGVGVNPLRGQNNVQGSCDMGSFPHEFPGYRDVADPAVRHLFETAWGRSLEAEPGLRIPNMFDAALAGTFRGLFVHGEDIAQSDPNSRHVVAALEALDLLVVQDLFLSETAAYAHVFLPGTSFLEKDGTFTNAERRVNRVRPVMSPRQGRHEWQIVADLATALGQPMGWPDSAAIMEEIARLTPAFQGISHARLDRSGSVQWPCDEAAPEGTPIMHRDSFARGKGQFVITAFVPTRERTSRYYPLILTTGRILSQYNVGAQTRRTDNVTWHPEDVLELHPHDAEERGIRNGEIVTLASRMGSTSLRAKLSVRVPLGVVYTTFHHPVTGANVVTTDQSDWATNCPEYKVTAVQVSRANDQIGGTAD